MAGVLGIDASAVQGHLDAPSLKKIGIEYAWHRCKVGNNPSRDVLFADNVRTLRDAGLIVGQYSFPFPLKHLDPTEQADLFADAALVDGHPLGMLAGELAPAFDLEWPPPEQWAQRALDADFVVEWALACLARMTERWGGVLPVVYSYPWFLQALSKGRGYDLLQRYPLWIAGGAGYLTRTTAPDTDREAPPGVPGWGSEYLFWQWNGNDGARLPNGVDADFDVFRHDLETLRAYCRAEPIPGPDWDTEPTAPILAEEPLDVHEQRQRRVIAMLSAA
jgi:GH25 family lysozyme M1 (1,4-beta-N-acetylmuramidase)